MDKEKMMLNLGENVNPWVKESIRKLRNNLLLSNSEHEVICFSSLFPNEGVTTITRMLAQYLSDIQKNVIIVSVDLKNRSEEITGTPYTLKEYLKGNCAIENIVYKVDENFDIIFGSDTNEDHSDLLYLKTFENLIMQLKNKYDLVMIDAPSFSIASETPILAQLADSLILVVRENNVKIDEFINLHKKLLKQNVAIRGVVINRVTETENLEIKVI
jgi:polysaccharide biosynthesis transport protein